MNLYIEIADVIGNAFLELLQNDRKEITFYDLDQYGAKVIEVLNREENVCARYIVSRESQSNILIDYSDFFEEYENDKGYRGIRLKEGKTASDVWARFCASLSVLVIKAFHDKDATAVLG